MKTQLSYLFFLLLSFPLSAQGDEEKLNFSNLSPDNYSLQWEGKSGRTYFLQSSSDLETWTYLPAIYAGNGTALTHLISETAPESFFRLIWTDGDNGGDPETADFDGDGISNSSELANDTDPFDYYNNRTHKIRITRGDNQSYTAGKASEQPIVFQVINANGTPLVNAPITINLDPEAQAGSLISLSASGSAPNSVFTDVRTNDNGEVYTWFIPPAQP